MLDGKHNKEEDKEEGQARTFEWAHLLRRLPDTLSTNKLPLSDASRIYQQPYLTKGCQLLDAMKNRNSHPDGSNHNFPWPYTDYTSFYARTTRTIPDIHTPSMISWPRKRTPLYLTYIEMLLFPTLHLKCSHTALPTRKMVWHRLAFEESESCFALDRRTVLPQCNRLGAREHFRSGMGRGIEPLWWNRGYCAFDPERNDNGAMGHGIRWTPRRKQLSGRVVTSRQFEGPNKTVSRPRAQNNAWKTLDNILRRSYHNAKSGVRSIV